MSVPDERKQGEVLSNAARALEEIRTQLNQLSRAEQAPKPTFREVWEKVGAAHGLKLASSDSFRSRANKYVLPLFGDLTEDTLTPLVAEEKLLSIPLSPQSIKHCRNIGRRVIKLAKKHGLWVRDNPFVDLDELPSVPTPDYSKRVLTKIEIVRILHAVPDAHYPLFAFAIYFGVRPRELLGLKWADIDLDRMVITVRRSYDRDRTKTGEIRHIPVSAEAMPHVWDAKRLAKDSVYVFPNKSGGLRSKDTRLSWVLRAAMARVGLLVGWEMRCRRCGHSQESGTGKRTLCPRCRIQLWPKAIKRPLTFRDLRRISCTLHQQAGVHPWVMSKVLGHSVQLPMAKTTADRYTYFDMEFIRSELEKFSLTGGEPSGGGGGYVPPAGFPVPTDSPENSSVGLRSQRSQVRFLYRALTEGVQPLAFSKGELLTVREVASLLRLKTVATVYRYVAKGKLKAVRWGPLIRITRAALHLFLDSNQRGRKRRR